MDISAERLRVHRARVQGLSGAVTVSLKYLAMNLWNTQGASPPSPREG